jgi:hypothetical protein
VTLLRVVALALLGLALAGCAQLRLGEPIPSIENVRKLQASGAKPLALGEFRLTAGKDEAMDRSVSVRSNNVYSPYDNSFAKYLRQTLASDLGSAGLLDPSSATVLSAELTDASLVVPMHVAPGVPTGPAQGRVAARFVVVKAGRRLYERELAATDSWPADFLGVTAISDGMNRYTALYRDLVRQLLDDPAFVDAVRR